MVCTASQLESKHSGNGSGRHRDYGNCVEHQCGEGGQTKNARKGEILPKPIVRTTLFYKLSAQVLIVFRRSWSKQIIEHERAEAAQEAATKGQQ